ncbi:MAG: three-Cys-motif partner protein TcmP, partial [Chlorobiaceae bacterium]|nr:three-Cys-motif partner protein TcmP [Chlorobiaceae bacterium]
MSLDGLNGFPELSGSQEGVSAENRLDAFAGYVEEFLALQDSGSDWKTIYFDAFAGSGSRRDEKKPVHAALKFTPEEERGYKGAAERIMGLERGFDYYYFVDDHRSLVKLKEKLGDLPDSGHKRMIFRPEECNRELERLSDAMHSDEFSSLLFLDPVGFSIDWQSIARFAGTRTDLWIVIQTGSVVNRLLDARGNPEGLFLREDFFGMAQDEMTGVLVRAERNPCLFVEETLPEKINRSILQVTSLYVHQLKKHWRYVTDMPFVLHSERNVSMCAFVCATD